MGQKGMLLNDGMVKYHTTGDISVIQMEDGKGISISSDGNIELLANNINLKAGAKLNITAGKKIEISCIGSSMIIDGEGDRIDKKAPDIFFDSPENVIVDVPVDAIEQLFASHAAERKAAVLEFTPDEIRITAENKFDDGIYQLLYGVWKESSGEYDPKDDKLIVDPRGNTTTKNETKFKYWAMEQYGMTAEEYRGHTFKGTGKTILETAGAYFKVTAPIDAKKGITYLVKNGVTPKNILKAAFGMTNKNKSFEIGLLKEETNSKRIPMDSKLFQKIKKSFEKNGGAFIQDADAQALLKFRGAEACTLAQDTILFKPNPTVSEVFEELIHTSQYRNGVIDGTFQSVTYAEIEAAEKLIRNRKAYKIPDTETLDTIKRAQNLIYDYHQLEMDSNYLMGLIDKISNYATEFGIKIIK